MNDDLQIQAHLDGRYVAEVETAVALAQDTSCAHEQLDYYSDRPQKLVALSLVESTV